jgi:Ca2+-binding RTX toxin-like protein
VVNGVLHVGSTAVTTAQIIGLSEAGGIISINQAGLPLQQVSATGIHLVSVVGGAGNDNINLDNVTIPATVNAGNGNNFVVGGLANDTLSAGTGDDTIIGAAFSNVISGGAGNNVLYGGTGNDVINGGPGSDWIYPGGYGLSLYNDPESDTINGGTGTEKLDLAGNADNMTIDLSKGTITDKVTGAVTHIKSVRNLWAGAGNDLIVGATAGGILLNAGSGNDTLFGISASDIIYGGIGDDQAFLDGNQGFIDLLGNHASTPGNIDQYNQGTTILPPSVDASDIKVTLQKSPG